MDWTLTSDTEELHAESGLWLTHCYKYRRRTGVKKFTLPYYRNSGSLPKGTPSGYFSIQHTSEMLDRSNVDRIRKADSGSDFFLLKDELLFDSSLYSRKPGNVAIGWPGGMATPLVPQFVTGAPSMSPYNAESWINMDARGAKLLSQAIPGRSDTATLNAVVELLRDFPKVMGSYLLRNRDLRAGGEEFLNWNFAVAPLIRDIKQIASAIIQSDELVRQYARDANRRVRRKRSLPVVRNTSAPYYGTVWCYGKGDTYTPHGPGSQVMTESERVWFSGEFQYWLPIGSSTLDKYQRWAQEANYILGLDPLNPQLWWNLTPFSWLVDWFANTQEVYKNISALAFDGTVMRYGYVMRERRKTYSLAYNPNGLYALDSAHSHRVFTCKQRRKARPYGFGIDDTSLSGRQYAILAALGLTQGRRSGSPDVSNPSQGL